LSSSSSSSSTSSDSDVIIDEITGRRVVPEGETVSKDYIPDIITALSLKADCSPKEIWDYYETLAQSCIPPRTYEETLKIRDKTQEVCLLKRRRIPKPTKYVVKKQQGEIKSLNVTPQPPPKRPCISFEKRKEVYEILCSMSDEERHEYFCRRSKLMNLSVSSLRRIWSEGTQTIFYILVEVNQNYLSTM
jgi:hypothetical protein